jgi:hypothetical protein
MPGCISAICAMSTTGRKPSVARFAAPMVRWHSMNPARTVAWKTIASISVDPQHHPAAVKRLTEPKRRSYRLAGGELPGRKIDGRR